VRYHLVITSVLLFALSLPLTGCHRKFKKFVEQNDEVELTVAVPGRPNVDLVESNGSAQTNIGALVQAATEVAGAVEGVKLRRRLEQIMRPENIQSLAADGAIAEMESRYPLGLAEPGQGDGLMELNLVSYGIIQSGGGPVFYADYHARVYNKSRKRVYRHSTSCRDREFFTGYRTINVAGTVATIAYLNSLSDEELQLKLDAAIDRCTSQVFANLRKHAG